DLENRRVDRIDRDPADLCIRVLVLSARNVSASAFDGQFHVQTTLTIQRGDVQVRIVDLDPGRSRDIGSGPGAGPLLAQVGNDRFVEFGRYDQGLQVEAELGDILLDSRHGADRVEACVDPDGRDGGTGDRVQQGSAKRVAEGVADAGLERFDGDP